MFTSMVTLAAEATLDYLLEQEGRSHTDDPGRVLVSLARLLFGDDVEVGDAEYHFTSKAVIWLEENDFVVVTRKNQDEKAKANIILQIEIKD